LKTVFYNADTELVALLKGGDKTAFKKLFDKYGKRLYQFSLKFLREKEDAEDLLNEVFLKIWENRRNLKTDTSFQSYLFTIAYNNIRQRFLKRSREEKYIQIFATEHLTENLKNEDQIDYLSFVKVVNDAIEMLPARRREIFLLYYKEELKSKQIAEKLNITEQFVRNQLTMAKKTIIDKFKEPNKLEGMLFFSLFIAHN
jgi:RNA polymerase sigma-70 factor (ECF subfamily)